MFDVGRICMKTAGREAGKFCVIVDVMEGGFVMVTGPKAVTHVKRRKCNVEHLEPTPDIIKIQKNASDDDVIGAYKKHGLFARMGTSQPGQEEIKAAADEERKRRATSKKAEEKKASDEKKEEKAAEQVVKEELKEIAKEEIVAEPAPAPEEPKKAKPAAKPKKPAAKKATAKAKKEPEKE